MRIERQLTQEVTRKCTVARVRSPGSRMVMRSTQLDRRVRALPVLIFDDLNLSRKEYHAGVLGSKILTKRNNILT